MDAVQAQRLADALNAFGPGELVHPYLGTRLVQVGEGSEVWNRQVEVTRQVVAACSDRNTPPDEALKVHVEHALRQVGYHDDEADVIARRLSSSAPEDDDDSVPEVEEEEDVVGPEDEDVEKAA